jgi:DNA-directed RNA polymerase alpha subunit
MSDNLRPSDSDQRLANRLRPLIAEIRNLLDRMTYMIPNPPDEDSIDLLEITARGYHCLNNGGIKSITQLRETSRSDLMALPNLGVKTYTEIREALERYDREREAA